MHAHTHRPMRLLLAVEAEGGATHGAVDVQGLICRAVHTALHSTLAPPAHTPAYMRRGAPGCEAGSLQSKVCLPSCSIQAAAASTLPCCERVLGRCSFDGQWEGEPGAAGKNKRCPRSSMHSPHQLAVVLNKGAHTESLVLGQRFWRCSALDDGGGHL